MDKTAQISEAKRLLAHAREAASKGALNIAPVEVNKQRFNAELLSVDWKAFVSSADYHYFVGRILLSQQAHLYGLFCGHQCVENYLKAYLVSVAQNPPTIHVLYKLLEGARSVSATTATFLASEDAETICKKFEPFYEIGRYPVQISRPKGGMYVAMPSADLLVLDYFVYEMRKLLPLGAKDWDILGPQGHYELSHVKDVRPEFYSMFMKDNLNCA